MNLSEQYNQLSQALDIEEYNLHSLRQQIQGSEAVTAQIITSAKRIGKLEEQIANLESNVNHIS